MSSRLKTNGHQSELQRVAVVGLGYVGLPTAALIAATGLETLGVDINTKLIDQLQSGLEFPREEGLRELLIEAAENQKLYFSSTLRPSDVYVITVPTPITESKKPDLRHVMAVVEDISKVIEDGQLVVLESTSPPGTTESISKFIKALRPDLVSSDGELKVLVAYCPERVLPGNALHEITTNNRIIGGLTPAASNLAMKLYSKFTNGEISTCTALEAEMVKLVENAFRDVNIAFANQISRISSAVGVDAEKVIELANRHPRVEILSPGVGVGGHCISVDPWFLVDSSPLESELLIAARLLNDRQPKLMAQDLAELTRRDRYSRIICLGLSYKPNSDDLRESPSIHFVEELLSQGLSSEIVIVEPNLSVDQIESLGSEYGHVLSNVPDTKPDDLVVLLVGHNEFRDFLSWPGTHVVIQGTGQAKVKSLANSES